jgi:hypothetical protein
LPDLPTGDVFLLPMNIIEVPAGESQRAARSFITIGEYRAIEPGDRRSRGLVALDTRSAIEARAHRVYTNAARKFTPLLDTFFDEQKARVTSKAKRSTDASYWPDVPIDAVLDKRGVDDLVAMDWSFEDAELDKIIRQLWDLMGETATDQTNDLINTDLQWDIANPWVREVLGDVGTRVTDINETTRQAIAQVVNDSLAEGVSIPQLSERLEGLYDETYAGRSTTIARTESQVAYNMAQVRGYNESGLINEAELLDNPAHTEDPGSDGLTCAQRNGLIVPLDEVQLHIAAEHPNGSLAVAPVLATPLGSV